MDLEILTPEFAVGISSGSWRKGKQKEVGFRLAGAKNRDVCVCLRPQPVLSWSVCQRYCSQADRATQAILNCCLGRGDKEKRHHLQRCLLTEGYDTSRSQLPLCASV